MGGAVRARQAAVGTEYDRRVKKADDAHFPHYDEPRPFKTLYTALPRVLGLVVGMHGEFSSDVKKLQGLVTDRLTALWSDRTNLPEAEGAPIFKSEIRSKWAFTALRLNAQVRLDAARAIMLGKVGVADEDG